MEVSHGRGVLVEYRRRPSAPDADALQKDGNRLRNLVAELRGKGFPDEWIVTEVAAALPERKPLLRAASGLAPDPQPGPEPRQPNGPGSSQQPGR